MSFGIRIGAAQPMQAEFMLYSKRLSLIADKIGWVFLTQIRPFRSENISIR